MEIMRQCANSLADANCPILIEGAEPNERAHLNCVRVFIFIGLFFISLISLFRGVLNFCFPLRSFGCIVFAVAGDNRSSSHVYYFLWESFNLNFWSVFYCSRVIFILFSTKFLFFFSLHFIFDRFFVFDSNEMCNKRKTMQINGFTHFITHSECIISNEEF